MLVKHPALIAKYGIAADGLRPIGEIIAAEAEYFDRIWYGRKPLDENGEWFGAGDPPPADIYDVMVQYMRELEATYGGRETLDHGDDFAWGMKSGKLSALRWVLGDDWDNLDT
jgi:hypothetical protein